MAGKNCAVYGIVQHSTTLYSRWVVRAWRTRYEDEYGEYDEYDEHCGYVAGRAAASSSSPVEGAMYAAWLLVASVR